MLDVRRLILLRELEARGSLAAVSRALGISSSAISQQLTKLEAEVGMSLLEQVGRNIRLTDVGQKLANRADEVLAILEMAEAEVESRRSQVQGSVRLVTFGTFALRYLPDVLQRLAATHEDVVVDFEQAEPSEALDAVAGRRADIAVIDEYPNTSRRVDHGVASIHLLRDPIDAYAPKPVDSIGELAMIPWVFEATSSDASIWARRICRDAGFEPRVRFESPDLRLHRGLVISGMAAAFIPRMAFDASATPLPEASLKYKWPPTVALDLHRDIYAVTRRGAQSRPAVAALLKHLQTATAQPTGDVKEL